MSKDTTFREHWLAITQESFSNYVWNKMELGTLIQQVVLYKIPAQDGYTH